jgi:hypothetical protein
MRRFYWNFWRRAHARDQLYIASNREKQGKYGALGGASLMANVHCQHIIDADYWQTTGLKVSARSQETAAKPLLMR